MSSTLHTKIITATGLEPRVVTNIIDLLEQGNTIPFIARYRKEMTGGATDEQLREFEDIYAYQQKLIEKKADIIRLLEEKGVITDELRAAITHAQTLSALDDIYRPYKDKKNTRATKAIAKGLQPLADVLLTCQVSEQDFRIQAEEYIIDTGDAKTSVADTDEAIQGAMDIVAEIVADDPALRSRIREHQDDSVQLQSQATKHFKEHSVYEIYKDYTKPLASMPSYAYLAIARAEKDKQLRVKLVFNENQSISSACDLHIPIHASDLQSILKDAIIDGVKRLLHPSLERAYRSDKKSQSDREAIDIFGKNVEELLLSSPVRGKVIMGFDPAYRTGCKIAVIDETGKYLAHTVVYPTEPQNKIAQAEQVLLELIRTHSIGLICIGNGTASRESESFVAEMIRKHDLDTKYLVVSEAGASVYSASKLATQEYPDLDVTVRGAINIAQRVQDPLSTYVKIDPKSLGVGQYQHDVDQKLLGEKLSNHIEDAVNKVGVDINTASRAILQHIAGLSTTMAKNVVTRRDEHGSFAKRSQIKKVKGVGPKAFEQCAGFLRINGATEPLDSTGIHPESYAVTYQILEHECGVTKKSLTLPYQFDETKDLSDISARYEVGHETLRDIVRELANPGLDPRESFDEAGFKSDVLTMEDLTKGMKLTGIVRNITDFGAFVDIGLKNDGLVHKSQLANGYVRNPFDVVSIGQQLAVTVLDVDLDRKRVSLSAKTGESSTSRPKQKRAPKPSRDQSHTSSLGAGINFVVSG